MFISKKKYLQEVNLMEKQIEELNRKINKKLTKEKLSRKEFYNKVDNTFEEMKEEIIILRKIANKYNHPHTCDRCGKFVLEEGQMHDKCPDSKTDALMKI